MMTPEAYCLLTVAGFRDLMPRVPEQLGEEQGAWVKRAQQQTEEASALLLDQKCPLQAQHAGKQQCHPQQGSAYLRALGLLWAQGKDEHEDDEQRQDKK